MNTFFRSRVSKTVSLLTILAVVSLSTQFAMSQGDSGRHGGKGGKQASSQVKKQQGNGNSKGKVQQSNRSRVAGLTPPLNSDKGEFKTGAGKSMPTNRLPGNAGENNSSKTFSGVVGRQPLGIVDSEGWDEVPEGLMFGFQDRKRPASQTNSGTGNGPMTGPKQATNEEIIKALNNGTQLRSTGQQGNVGGRSKSALSKPRPSARRSASTSLGRKGSIECLPFEDTFTNPTRSYTGDLFDLNSAEWIKTPTTSGASKFQNVMGPRSYEPSGPSHHDNWRESDK